MLTLKHLISHLLPPSRSESIISCISTKITAFNENQYFFRNGPAFYPANDYICKESVMTS